MQTSAIHTPSILASGGASNLGSFSKSYDELSAVARQAFKNNTMVGNWIEKSDTKRFSRQQLKDYTHLTSAISVYSDLFQEIAPLIEDESINIAVCGAILGDGYGDLWAINQMSETLKGCFPKAKVIRCIDDLHYEDALPPSSPDDGFYHWQSSRGDTLTSVRFRSEVASEQTLRIREEAKEKVSRCQVIFNGANCDVSSGILTEDQLSQSIRVFEPGWGASSDQCLAMGLGPAHAGLLINPSASWGGLDALESLPLRQHLLGCTEAPSQQHIAAYLEKTALGVSYKGGFGYIQAFCAATAAEGKKTRVDIVMEGGRKPYHKEELYWLPSLGAKKVSWMGPDGQEVILFEAANASPDGLEVRILGFLPVSERDFQRLVRDSSYAAGCTGDGSFVQVGRVQLPFYGVYGHKQRFYQDLIDLSVRLKCPSLASYLERAGTAGRLGNNVLDTYQTLGKAMADPQVHREWAQVFQWIQQHSFAPVLRDSALRAIVHSLHPEIKDRERQLLSAGTSSRRFYSTMRSELRQAFSLPAEEPPTDTSQASGCGPSGCTIL